MAGGEYYRVTNSERRPGLALPCSEGPKIFPGKLSLPVPLRLRGISISHALHAAFWACCDITPAFPARLFASPRLFRNANRIGQHPSIDLETSPSSCRVSCALRFCVTTALVAIGASQEHPKPLDVCTRNLRERLRRRNFRRLDCCAASERLLRPRSSSAPGA